MNVKTLRTSVAAAMGGAVLLAGLLVGAAFALAQETDEPEIAVSGDTMERGFHAFRDGARRFGGNLEDIAEGLDTTLEELRDKIAAGATLEEIATDAGVDLDALLEELRAEALAAIDQQVEDGNLTQEQADSIKERIEGFDPDRVSSFGPRGFFGERGDGFGDLFGGGRGPGGFLGELDLDIDLAELGDLLKSGVSLDEALAELGVDLDSVVADATAAAVEHIDELLSEGTITQEQADQMKDMIENFDLAEGLPFGMGGFKFDLDFENFDMDRFHGPRGGGFGFFGDDGSTADTNAEDALLDV